jgi:hypothetical protein
VVVDCWLVLANYGGFFAKFFEKLGRKAQSENVADVATLPGQRIGRAGDVFSCLEILYQLGSGGALHPVLEYGIERIFAAAGLCKARSILQMASHPPFQVQ